MKRFFASFVAALLLTPVLNASMTKGALAIPSREVQSAMSGVSAIDALFDRIAQRKQTRQRDDVKDDNASDTPILRRASSSRSSARTGQSSSRAAAPSDNSLSGFRADVLKLVNAERAKKNLAAYAYNKTLESSAQDYAAHMKSENCFSHTACGSTLKQRMHASGYYQGGGKSYSYGENIARGQDTAAEVMEDWMNSPSHRDAILSSKYKEIGIGKSGNYWVQHFGAIR